MALHFLTKYVPPASLAPDTARSAFRSALTKLALTSTLADFTSPSTCSRRSRSSESQTNSQVSAGSVTVTRFVLGGHGHLVGVLDALVADVEREGQPRRPPPNRMLMPPFNFSKTGRTWGRLEVRP